jgi:hypothetical protein
VFDTARLTVTPTSSSVSCPFPMRLSPRTGVVEPIDEQDRPALLRINDRFPIEPLGDSASLNKVDRLRRRHRPLDIHRASGSFENFAP